MANAQEDGKNTNPKTLNIVFHGSFAFVSRDYGFEVLTAAVDGHGNFAGTWQTGGLKPLPPGTYTLCGAKNTGKRAEFDQGTIVVVEGGLAGDYKDHIYSSWKLPHPTAISTSILVNNEKGNFKTYTDDIRIPKHLGMVYTFTFATDGSAPFSIDQLTPRTDHYWSAEPERGPVVNLHVFAQDEHRMTKDPNGHSSDAFQKLIRLTKIGERAAQLVEVNYSKWAVPLVQAVHLGDLPQGLKRIELVNLAVSGLLNPHSSGTRAIDGGALPAHPCPGIYGP